MSRASRRRAARAKAAAQSSQAPAAFSPSGYAGAEPWSRERGYVYFPELDTQREVDSYTRSELLRKARFLYANVGFVRRIVNGISRMVVGVGLSPQATTKDPDWNLASQKSFENRAVARHIWDVNGKYNFYQMQRAIKRCSYKDGDCGVVLTESEAGRAAR
jgi:Phage portal protein, lambda family.